MPAIEMVFRFAINEVPFPCHDNQPVIRHIDNNTGDDGIHIWQRRLLAHAHELVNFIARFHLVSPFGIGVHGSLEPSIVTRSISADSLR